ncbi:uracil-DNA glycosylase [Ferrovibrio sp.]|uniref:uracil-DNA glycosylase n=1 Tax=Ferrovibrio sp. TaxID=1917215 RepID=UPI0039197D24
MSSSQRVLGHSCGSLNARILFVGEAPGRLGADGSLIPFHGDKSGDNFEELIAQVGLSRSDLFITNSALCNPRDDKGNNAPPTKTEIENCSNFLKRQIDIVNPKVVVTLGTVALAAVRSIENHNLSLSSHVRTKHRWYGRILIPLYHPGQRAMIHRSFHNQLSDYKFVHDIARSEGKAKKSLGSSIRNEKTYWVVREILDLSGELGYFALHKIFYLTEVEYYRRAGTRLTASYIIRQKDGPYAVDLHIRQLIKRVGVIKKLVGDQIRLRVATDLFSQKDGNHLSSIEREVIGDCVRKYASLSDFDLKRLSYMTRPMRKIMNYEQKYRLNMYNSPIDFSELD